MSGLGTSANLIREHYLPLVKSRQTLLLTLTGMAGAMSHPPADWMLLANLAGSLLLSIAGCSVLNMVFDRDIDRLMSRTARRPMPAGQVTPDGAALLGSLLICLGLIWAGSLSGLYFVLVLAGAGLNVLVYTLWLKRRTAWSIAWGGLAGSMPILAGRALAVGQIDTAGVLLALVIFAWIPSHNLTLTSLYASDYLAANVPAFVNAYGKPATLRMVAFSSLVTGLLVEAAFAQLGTPGYLLVVLAAASLGLAGIAFSAWINPAQARIRFLYHYSSLYMLGMMLLLMVQGMR